MSDELKRIKGALADAERALAQARVAVAAAWMCLSDLGRWEAGLADRVADKIWEKKPKRRQTETAEPKEE